MDIPSDLGLQSTVGAQTAASLDQYLDKDRDRSRMSRYFGRKRRSRRPARSANDGAVRCEPPTRALSTIRASRHRAANMAIRLATPFYYFPILGAFTMGDASGARISGREIFIVSAAERPAPAAPHVISESAHFSNMAAN